MPVNLSPALIGAWLGFDVNFYRFIDGQIDEMAIYATALTADRIAAHYAAASAPVTAPPIAVSIQGVTVQISWTGGSGFMLQHNSDLNNPAGWTDLPGGNTSPLSISTAVSHDFFRLRKL